MRPDVEGKIVEQAKDVAKRYGLILASKPYEDTAYFADKFDSEAAQARHKGQEKLSTTHVEISEIKQLAESKETREAAKQLLKESESKVFQYKLLEPDQVKFFKNKKSPCLEPFKTFYASYDGRVFPCCFKGTENSLGDLSTGQDANRCRGQSQRRHQDQSYPTPPHGTPPSPSPTREHAHPERLDGPPALPG